MSNYNQIKNAAILNPTSVTDIGTATNRIGNVYMSGSLLLGDSTLTADNTVTPRVQAIGYGGNDLATNPSGGGTITIVGSGFKNGMSIVVGSLIAGSVTVINSTQLTFVAPALAAGSYPLYLINPDGGTATQIPGLQYSGLPTWTTTSGLLGTSLETESVNVSVAASSDSSVTYSVVSGSLPTGLSLATTTGAITGTLSTVSGSTTYNFTINAADAENQDTPRNFSYVVNPDVVTWSTPSNGANYSYANNSTVTESLSASSTLGKNITYTATGLPTGLSISGSNIAGTVTSTGSTTATITATSADTNKTASITLNFAVTSSFSASGGTETVVSGYKYHTFTSGGTFTVPSGAGTVSVNYLIVAGGGGGGGTDGNGTAGGGAGGVLYGTYTPAAGSYSITVGNGGSGGAGGGGRGGAGSLSSAFGFSATGGGGGGGRSTGQQTGANGGSGGGGAYGAAGGTGVAGQGYAGGTAPVTTTAGRPGAGGGGAGGVGVSPSSSNGGNGGIGVQWLNNNYYGGGGGGSLNTGAGGAAAGGLQGTGGLGGGATAVYQTIVAAQANTGGGGAGSAGASLGGGAGGSGIVIIRYAI